MTPRDYAIEKIKSMPEDIIREICDFIDFLEIRKEKNIDRIEENDFKDYLNGMERYEEMLVSGQIKWKYNVV